MGVQAEVEGTALSLCDGRRREARWGRCGGSKDSIEESKICGGSRRLAHEVGSRVGRGEVKASPGSRCCYWGLGPERRTGSVSRTTCPI